MPGYSEYNKDGSSFKAVNYSFNNNKNETGQISFAIGVDKVIINVSETASLGIRIDGKDDDEYFTLAQGINYIDCPAKYRIDYKVLTSNAFTASFALIRQPSRR